MSIKVAFTFIIGIMLLITILGVGFHYSFLNFDAIGPNIAKYVFLGQNFTEIRVASFDGPVGELGIIIVGFMVWLIIFVGFGDVLENFAAFSSGIAWIIAFAVAVIAVNLGFIQAGIVYLVGAFAFLGTLALFAALLGAFIAFFGVNWGMASLSSWIKRRQTMLHAATGRTYASEGLETLEVIGKKTATDGS